VTRVLVVAKAPVPGQVKTRLGAQVGMLAAAELAAASLLDVLEAAVGAVGVDRCHLSLAGDLIDGVRSAELHEALTGWSIHPQTGDDFADRLSRAHRALGGGSVVQVGMDTPQLTPALLHRVAGGLRDSDATLAPAADGGWWALALRDPDRARALEGVPMSSPTTYADTLTALRSEGLTVASAEELTDVDTLADAELVARAAPGTRFAATWARTTAVTS